MALLKMYKCKECSFEFSDLPSEASFMEMGDINPATGKLKNNRQIPQECPDCESSNIDPIIENGKHKDA